MALCDSFLTQDIMVDCSAPSYEIKNKAWLFNFDDIEGADAIVKHGEIDAGEFTLKTGKRGYIIEQLGKKPFAGSNTALVVGTYRNTFTHQVKLFVPYQHTDDGLSVATEIANSKLVVVFDSGEEKVIYGMENGLFCTECTRTVYDDDTEGGWVITLEETKAKYASILLPVDSQTLDGLCKTTV